MIIFPDLMGLKFDRTKSPTFSTQIKQSVSGYEVRTSTMAFPIWKFELQFEFLRENASQNELKLLAGFYLQNKGAFDTWLYDDKDDNTVTSQTIGFGDGTNKEFQLIRDFGGFVDIIQAPNTITVTINDIATTDYTISKGVITFNTAPINGASIKWSGSFYFPCRFEDDSMDFNIFMYQLWEAKKVAFRSVKL